jgi:hypothetical protein
VTETMPKTRDEHEARAREIPADWLRATIAAARKEIATWPAWKKAELAAETHREPRT